MVRVLLLVPGYLPGYKSGGPVRTVSNMVDSLSGEVEFFIICMDRDLGDSEPYSDIQVNHWNDVAGAKVKYIAPTFSGYRELTNLLCSGRFDFIHLNSFFSFRFSIYPMILKRICQIRESFILGPRGEFSKGALSLKSFKKKFFILLAKSVGLHSGVVWHASTDFEADDIRSVFGNYSPIKVAVDISRPSRVVVINRRDASAPLKIVLLSRISIKKNILGAISVLKCIGVPVVFDVYGPIEDEDYWLKCMAAVNLLPVNVAFKYCGSLLPNQVAETLSKYDLFFCPTFGENFGHVIAEALGVGLPLLISDTTPWRDLEKKSLGWDVSLDNVDKFVSVIEKCYSMDADEYYLWRGFIRAWALANIGNADAVEQSRKLFDLK